jgi:hypothetical protein
LGKGDGGMSSGGQQGLLGKWDVVAACNSKRLIAAVPRFLLHYGFLGCVGGKEPERFPPPKARYRRRRVAWMEKL